MELCLHLLSKLIMCGVRSRFSVEGTNVWNYTSIWSGGKNVLLVPEVRRFGVIPSFRAEAKNVARTPPLQVKINNICKYRVFQDFRA